jgi:hypothetical protein
MIWSHIFFLGSIAQLANDRMCTMYLVCYSACMLANAKLNTESKEEVSEEESLEEESSEEDEGDSEDSEEGESDEE